MGLFGVRSRCAGLRAVVACCLAAASLEAGVALADDATPTSGASVPKVPIGFSRLVVDAERDLLGMRAMDFRAHLLDQMRQRGFAAVGGENVLFDKDEGRRAEYIVGGEVRELACSHKSGTNGCRIGVEWQVLDVPLDKVVYTVLSRAAVVDPDITTQGDMARALAARATDSLLQRPAFRRALVSHATTGGAETPSFPEATLGKCAPGRPVAISVEDLLSKVVVVRQPGSGFGSGFFVSSEGLVMTAAHVVRGMHGAPVTLRLRDGKDLHAVVARIAPHEDVALLRTVEPQSARPCMAIRPDALPTGAEVFAVGAPAQIDLAFSLTRGIVSGAPMINGERRIQTDAAVSPGNSGGPLADASGAVAGIVSSKIVESRVEGIAFAVPVPDALRALGLSVGAATDPSLLTATAAEDPTPSAIRFDDRADPVPSLDPEGDWHRSVAQESDEAGDRPQEQPAVFDTGAAARVRLVRWGGVAVAGTGALVALLSYAMYSPTQTTEGSFHGLQTANTLGWIASGVGAAGFFISFALPSGPPKARPNALRVGPAGAIWEGHF